MRILSLSLIILYWIVVPVGSFRVSLILKPSFSSSSTTTTTTRNTIMSSSPSDNAALPSGTGNLVISLRQAFENQQIGLILASQSPRRREILDMMGLPGMFETIPSPLDESALQLQLIEKGITHDPQLYTRTLAEEKARALAETLQVTRPTLVLGSDTIVDQDEAILEKPKDAQDAARMLRQLSGREHFVHTGVALYRCMPGQQAPEKVVSFVDQATVGFTDLSKADIQAYVDSGEPMDKAGSYGIQGIGGQFVSCVQGDFFTVMGLPMHRTSSAIGTALKDIVSES